MLAAHESSLLRSGESFYGEPFEDEPHQRLRFTRRGLLAMANPGEHNMNESQFFVSDTDRRHHEKRARNPADLAYAMSDHPRCYPRAHCQAHNLRSDIRPDYL